MAKVHRYSYTVNMAALIDHGNKVNPVDSLTSRRENSMPQPKWERVAEAIRDQIRHRRDLRQEADGLYLPGYTTLVARADWPDGVGKASYGTIRQAIWQLKAEGWLDGEQGIGLRVREDHPA